ncbi:thiamine-phosphate kinase [bacterium]|nr:thiamine-phosphate kinase [bacterium]
MAPKTSIQQVDEFGLINLISRVLKSSQRNSQLVLGIGDDAAVFKTSKKMWNVATVDALVEGIHFDLRYTNFEKLGRKALSSNLSDIAAMGAVPTWALLNLTIPAKITADNITELYRGISAVAKKYQTQVIGGNITRAKNELVICITLLGEVEPAFILKRSSARAGDIIAVTGDLGASQAGLRVLQKRKPSSVFSYITEKHLNPEPRNEWIRRLLDKGVKINGCIDISDGLSSDLSHVCRASNVGAELELAHIPVHPETLRAAQMARDNVLEYVLHGGEEYELLMTLTPRNFKKAKRILGKNITAIGRIAASHTISGLSKNRKIKIESKGYKHF